MASELLKIDIADPDARVAAIPRLKELLRRYPHPLAYETLIHAYVDAGRYDEAKGVAFAARERRNECARSSHPEMLVTGMYDSQEAFDALPVVEREGHRIAVLNYTYGTNGIPLPQPWAVRLLDEAQIAADAEAVRAAAEPTSPASSRPSAERPGAASRR